MRFVIGAMLAVTASLVILDGCERKEAGVAQAAHQRVLHFKVTGMHCDGCAGTITDRLMELEGVTACTVSFERSQAEVTVSCADMEDPIIAAVKELQYGIEPASQSGNPESAELQPH